MAMDRDQVRMRLAALRDEARTLADAPSVAGEQVEDWRKRTASVLEDVYGPDSEPTRDFARIKFDDSKIVNVAERVFQEAADQQGVDISGLKIRLPSAEKVFRSGLHEAAELLTSLTHP